jgi:hypothetical protein
LEKIQTIEKLFYYINAYTYLILPILFLFFKKTGKGDNLILAIYGIVCFTLLYSYYHLPYHFKQIHLYVYTAIEYLFFTILIFPKISNKLVRVAIVILSALFLAFQLISYLYYRGTVLDTTSIGIETILLFLYIIYFFYEYFRKPKSIFIYSFHFFWIIVGILMYLGGTFFFNILINHMPKDQIIKYWDLTYIVEILKNVLFSIAILTFSNKTDEKPLHQTQIPYLDLDTN